MSGTLWRSSPPVTHILIYFAFNSNWKLYFPCPLLGQSIFLALKIDQEPVLSFNLLSHVPATKDSRLTFRPLHKLLLPLTAVLFYNSLLCPQNPQNPPNFSRQKCHPPPAMPHRPMCLNSSMRTGKPSLNSSVTIFQGTQYKNGDGGALECTEASITSCLE